MQSTSTPTRRKTSTASKKSKSPRFFALVQAIRTSDTSSVKKLVSEMPMSELCESFSYKCPSKTVNNEYFNMSLTTPMRITPLGYAVMLRSLGVTRAFVETKPGVLRCTLPSSVYRPLELSVMFGKSDITKYLVSKNAPIGDVLHDTVSLDNTNLVTSLVRSGANVTKKSWSSDVTPLEMARSAKMLEILVEAGANVNSRNTKYIVGGTPLMTFLWFENSCKGVKYLIDKGTDMKRKGTYRNVSGINALHALAMSKNVFTTEGKKTLQILCDAFSKQRISLNQKTSENKTALTYMLEQIFQPNDTSSLPYMVRNDLKYRSSLVPLVDVVLCFMKLGADIKQVRLSGNRKTTPIDDLVFKYALQNTDIRTIFNGEYGVKLTDTAFPFHIIVYITFSCSTRFLGTSKRLRETVDHLIRHGFDINASLPKPGNVSTLNVYGYDAPIHTSPLQMAETYIGKSNRKTLSYAKYLGDVHSIYVSRGGVTKTGRMSQRGSVREKRRNHVQKWTTGIYKNIQNSRRTSSTSKRTSPGTLERVNRYIAQEMRNTALRTPSVPRGYENVKYLYRGIHGPIAQKIMTNGEYKNSGYIAFSRNESVANAFGALKGGITMRIPVQSIPKGTPWIWFQGKRFAWEKNDRPRNRNIHNSDIDEYEVLLPPGTIRLVNKNAQKNKKVNLHITYTPSRNATSMKGAPMHRRK